MLGVLHVAAECYPAAKVGGLADVVGSLPKYLSAAGFSAGVVIPKYGTKWIWSQQYQERWYGKVRMHDRYYEFRVEECVSADLGFPFHVVDIPGFFDRPGIYGDTKGFYGYQDETERYLLFQQAVLVWVMNWSEKPAVIHCHDHHTGLIPFMVKYCPDYQSLAEVPTVLTIHNGVYQGAFSWKKGHLLPYFEAAGKGLLEWNDAVNPLAAGIKCCWKLTTVSPGYLSELQRDSNGLEWLFQNEWQKSLGILNGIDTQVWDPETDPAIAARLENEDIPAYKQANKSALTKRFQIRPDLPLMVFISRMVMEKGADLLPDAIGRFLYSGHRAAFLILGTGDPAIEKRFAALKRGLPGYVDVANEYNEGLAHQMYAGADFILMPSRVEPCGLNQMYAMRYGTVPIVRATGGLKDTVPDVGGEGGRGIQFTHFSLEDLNFSLYRALQVYHLEGNMEALRNRIMSIDFSWERSAEIYIQVYRSMTGN